MKISVAVLVLLALAACTGGPQVVGAPPPGIAYRIDDGSTAATDQRAEQYCQQFGKHAKLQSVDRDGGAPIAEYACN